MDDQADPSAGWLTLDVNKTSSPAPEDWYGKLFFFLHKMFTKFLARLKKIRVDFDIHNVNVKELPRNLERGIYSRIEVSLLCTGFAHTNLVTGGQYLRYRVSWNPHYTQSIISTSTIATTEPPCYINYYVSQRS